MKKLREEPTNEEIRLLLKEGKKPEEIGRLYYRSGRGVVARRRRLEHRAFLISRKSTHRPTVLRACRVPRDLDALVVERAKRDGVRPTDVLLDALEWFLK